MNELRWQARIETPRGARGSGFLVDDRHVVTCAHVVRGSHQAQVIFDHGTRSCRATVVGSGPWWSATAAAGDVAVLELPEPAAVEPAQFAPLTALSLSLGRGLTAYGFPEAYSDGVNTTFTAIPSRRIGGNLQVDAGRDVGLWLREGFSGAAACLAETGQVVGMVKAAACADRVGVMVPVTELIRHCPPLDDLITLGLLDAYAYQELRGAVAACKLSKEKIDQLRHALQRTTSAIPDHLNALLALVEAVVVTKSAESEEALNYHLAGLLTWLGTPEARDWVTRHLWGGLVPATPDRDGAISLHPGVQTIIDVIEGAGSTPPVQPVPEPPPRPDALARRVYRVQQPPGAMVAVLGFAVDHDTVIVPRSVVRQSPVQLVTADGDPVAADVLAIPHAGEVAVLGLRHAASSGEPPRLGRLVGQRTEVACEVLRAPPGKGVRFETAHGTVRGSHDRRSRYWLGPSLIPASPGSPVICAGRCVGFVALDGQSVIPATIAARQAWEAGALRTPPLPDAIEFLDHEVRLPRQVTVAPYPDAVTHRLREWAAGTGFAVLHLTRMEAGAALRPFLLHQRMAGWTVLEMTLVEVRDRVLEIRNAIGNVLIAVDTAGDDATDLGLLPDGAGWTATSVIRLLALT